MKMYRPTWAEIDLNAIVHNYNAVKERLNNDVKVMAVVKANAYGHGSVRVSRILQRHGVFYLGVATIDEAIKLRKAGIRSQLLVLGSVFPNELEAARRYNVTLTLCSFGILRILKKKNIKVKAHIKVDTGMGRIGFWHTEAIRFIKEAHRAKNIELEGIYTHFSEAGRDKAYTQYQIDSFYGLLMKLEKIGITIPLRHAANSIAVVDWKNSHFNMVRPGLIIYGMYPKRNFPKLIGLRPAMRVKTKISYLKSVASGRSVSYGRTYITQSPTRIATLPIGYADGYGRILSNKAKVLVHGNYSSVIGKITMDQTMINVSNVKNVRVGDEVVLIGKQKEKEIRLEELSRMAGTIPYEILTGISYRVPRIYI